MRFNRFIVFVILLLSFVLVRGASAQEPPPKTVTINPAFNDLVLAEEQDLFYGIKVTNTTDAAISFKVTLLDLKGLDATGGLLFAGPAEGGLAQKYGLAKWLSAEPNEFALGTNETREVKITVHNRDDLSPGGHYGSVLFEATHVETTGGDVQINLSPNLSSLVFLRKVGGEIFNLEFKRLDRRNRLWQLPGQANIKFYNPGNVHNVPRGRIELLDWRGRLVADGIINHESVTLLPETERTFPVALSQLAKSWLPGKYTLSVQYRYDGIDRVATYSEEFYYVHPLHVPVITLLAGLAFVVLYKWPVPSMLSQVRKRLKR